MYMQKDFGPTAELDLEPFKVKLTHVESGEGWSRAYANEVEFEYRRFLYLMKKFPNEQAAPLFDVDVFWHYHILDTMKYADDCEAVFGYFLHHFPYVGLRGAEDLELHQRAGERMRELYEQTFDCEYVRPPAAAQSGKSGQVAFSMHPSKVAFSMNPSKIASSMNASKIAFLMNTTQPAFSMNTSKAAFSMNAGALARPRYGDSAQAVAPSLAPPQ